MQSGQFITERLMPGIIREICEKQGISFTSFSDEWLLHLEKNGKVARVLGYKFGLNDSVASSIAQDKVASYELLKYYNILAVPHYLIRTKASESDWKKFPWQDGMVVKPLSGTSGHGVAKFFNLGKGAVAVDVEVGAPEVELAKRAKDSLGLRLAAVDIIELVNGSRQVLEVNDGIMMENFARQSMVNREKTERVYGDIIESIF